MRVPHAERVSLPPASPDGLIGLGARLYGLAVSDNQPQVAEEITYLFGEATCPSCRTVFNAAERIAAYHTAQVRPTSPEPRRCETSVSERPMPGVVDPGRWDTQSVYSEAARRKRGSRTQVLRAANGLEGCFHWGRVG